MLVTGAAGFVGKNLLPVLEQRGWTVIPCVRKQTGNLISVGEIGPDTDWSPVLRDIDVVMHLAARSHYADSSEGGALEAFRRVNSHGTRQLAEMAQRAGVKRFVLVSSAKANGEGTDGIPFEESQKPDPKDSYGLSKLEGEIALWETIKDGSMDGVVIRPPTVYGPGAKGIFGRLVKYGYRGYPVPLASIQNSRSYLFINNLVDALEKVAVHPEAIGNTFFVSDGEDLSTPDLVRKFSKSMKTSTILLPCPPSILRWGAELLRRESMVYRLLSSFQVDSTKIRRVLGWAPPFSTEAAFNITSKWLLSLGNKENP